MPFGLSAGGSKSSTKGKETVDKTETGTQSQQQSQASQGSTSTSTTGSTSTSNQGSSATTAAQSGKSSTIGSQTTSGRTQLFDDPVLSSLNAMVSGLMGSTGGAVDTSQMGFNRDQFVEGGMADATSRVNAQLEDSINQLTHQIGGGAGSNSAAALLANRLNSDASSSLAGTRSQLESTAAEIVRQNVATESGVLGQQQNFLGNLLNTLRGGSTTTTGTAQSSGTEVNSNESIGNQTNNSTGTQNTSQQQDSVNTLVQLLSSVLNSTNRTQGTTTVDSKTKQAGGGFGLSI